MKPFKWMFEEQNATKIEYKGKQVSALYRYDKKGKYRLKFTFVSTNSQYEQSIILHLDGFKGKIFWNGKRLKKERRRFPQIIFEETWAPKEFELEIILEEGDIGISNGYSKTDVGRIDCFMGGCAMIKEELGEDKFRFYCNDIDWDDDFDDLIFDLEIPYSYKKKDCDRVIGQIGALMKEMDEKYECVVNIDKKYVAGE